MYLKSTVGTSENCAFLFFEQIVKLENFGTTTQTVMVYILKGIAIWISPERTLVFPDLKLRSIQVDFDSSDIV